MKDVCVVGLGHVGLPLACLFALNGLEVTAFDANPQLIEDLIKCQIRFQEPGLEETLNEAFNTNNLTFTDKIQEANFYIICVNTPLTAQKKADLIHIQEAGRDIASILKPGATVILESTVPFGTTRNVLEPLLEKTGLISGEHFTLAYCPEKISPGNIIKGLIEDSRIIGIDHEEDAQEIINLYQTFVKGAFYVTGLENAEFIKLIEIISRDIGIALANELLKIAEKHNLNIWEAIKIANLHAKVGLLSPGPGVGGHCIPVDPYFLVEKEPNLTNLTRLARQINEEMPIWISKRIMEILKDLNGPKVTILGIAYKANLGETENSPSFKVIENLKDQGWEVKIYDPIVERPNDYNQYFQEAFKESDCIILLVEHEVYKHLDIGKISRLVRNKIVVDVKGFLKEEDWKKAGFKVKVLGRPQNLPQ
jgi:UDP-N-acetyl-D-mannosaminuronic acid dehydrogenase